jgi:hypothetical protein
MFGVAVSDTAGTDAQDSGALEAAPQGQAEQTDSTPAGGGNPAWDELRNEVGDTTFALLKPHVEKWDKQANERVTRANAEVKRYSELGNYDDLATYKAVATQLDEDPAGFFGRLRDELVRRGVPIAEANAAAADATEDQFDGDDDATEEEDPRDARIRQLEENLNGFLSKSEQAEQAKQVESWQGEWDSSFAAAKAKAPWLADEDDDVLRALAGPLFNDTDDVSVTFEKALASLDALRNRTLSTPRAGDSAPRLIPAGGGNPAAAQTQDVSKMGRRDTVDLVANFIKQRSGN